MAEENIEQIIKDHMATLPEPVKKAIASFDWAREVFDIGRKHGMHVDRIADLQTEVMLVVIGLISPRDFEEELNSRIERQPETADEVATEVNERVFLRIRNFMKDYYEKEQDKEGEINNSEKKVLKSAGVSIGDEDEEPQVQATGNKETYISLPETGGQDSNPPKADANATDDSSKPKVIAPSQVFKTKTTEISVEGKPKGFFDPYREPVE